MNFLGHAAVATWRRADGAFVLGAMLPDLATMIGARPPATRHAGLDAGMQFHYRTDEVFHRSAAFVELTRSAFAWLLTRGVERGRARAVAHVGVELLLDTELSREEPVRHGYLTALRRGAPRDLGRHLVWASSDGRLDFEDLRRRLLERGVSGDEPTAEATTLRLRRALATRPRLALDDVTEMVARDWVLATGPLVAARAGELARELAVR